MQCGCTGIYRGRSIQHVVDALSLSDERPRLVPAAFESVLFLIYILVAVPVFLCVTHRCHLVRSMTQQVTCSHRSVIASSLQSLCCRLVASRHWAHKERCWSIGWTARAQAAMACGECATASQLFIPLLL